MTGIVSIIFPANRRFGVFLDEASKAEAEKRVKASNIPHSIYRLGIVVEHSETGYIKSFDGLYGYFAGLYRMALKERRKQNMIGKHIELPIFIECSSTSTLNLVPVDWVVNMLIGLMEFPPINQTFSITHPNPPQAKIASVCSFFEIKYSFFNIAIFRYL